MITVKLAYRMPHQSQFELIPVAPNKPNEPWEQTYVRAQQWAAQFSTPEIQYEARIYEEG